MIRQHCVEITYGNIRTARGSAIPRGREAGDGPSPAVHFLDVGKGELVGGDLGGVQGADIGSGTVTSWQGGRSLKKRKNFVKSHVHQKLREITHLNNHRFSVP